MVVVNGLVLRRQVHPQDDDAVFAGVPNTVSVACVALCFYEFEGIRKNIRRNSLNRLKHLFHHAFNKLRIFYRKPFHVFFKY